MIDTLLNHPRALPVLIMTVSLGALAVAFAFEIWGGLQPCVLCLYQRYAYAAAFGIGLVGALFDGGPVLRRALVALAGLAFLGGAAVACFHVGVEQHWWRGTAECHAPVFDMSVSIDELRQQLLARDFVPCDVIPWSLFGISMAGYNALASLALAAACLWAVLALGRRHAS